MASYVVDNFKFGFASTSDKGVGELLDTQVCWKFSDNKKYVCDINNGYMRCNHNTLLSSENKIIIHHGANITNREVKTDNYRNIESLLVALNKTIVGSGQFSVYSEDKRFLQLKVLTSYKIEFRDDSPILHTGFEKKIYEAGTYIAKTFWSKSGRKELVYVTLPNIVNSGMVRHITSNNTNISNIVGLLVLMDGKDDSDYTIISSNDFVGVDVSPQNQFTGTLKLFYNTGQLLEFDRSNLLENDVNFEVWFSMRAV